MLLVTQYSTKPAGKTKNMTLNTSGMIHIMRACTGSGGVGLSQVWSSVEAVITNAKAAPVTAQVREPAGTPGLRVAAESAAHTTRDGYLEWNIPVPANSARTLTYTLRWTN